MSKIHNGGSPKCPIWPKILSNTESTKSLRPNVLAIWILGQIWGIFGVHHYRFEGVSVIISMGFFFVIPTMFLYACPKSQFYIDFELILPPKNSSPLIHQNKSHECAGTMQAGTFLRERSSDSHLNVNVTCKTS